MLRFIIGVAIAADYPIATALLSEWLPRRRRAFMFTSVIIIWYLGTALVYFAGYLITYFLGDAGWRWELGSSAVLAAVIFLLRLGTPESPRWLAGAGRSNEAARVIEQALGIRVSPDDLRQAVAAGGPDGLGQGNLANLATAIVNLVFATGCLPAMWLLESAGRRTVIIWSFGLMILPLLALGAWAHTPAPFAIAFFCLYALFSGGPGILEWGYPNELFPTHIRAAAVGMAVALTRFGAAVGTFLVPLALTSLGVSATMYAGAAITFVGFLACVAWAEETRHRSLEDSGGDGRALAGAETAAAGRG